MSMQENIMTLPVNTVTIQAPQPLAFEERDILASTFKATAFLMSLAFSQTSYHIDDDPTEVESVTSAVGMTGANQLGKLVDAARQRFNDDERLWAEYCKFLIMAGKMHDHELEPEGWKP